MTKQVGGSHYKRGGIQPIEYILANDIPFCEGSVIKYLFRWKDKGGIEDLKKAIHYIEFLIDEEERKEKEAQPIGQGISSEFFVPGKILPYE